MVKENCSSPAASIPALRPPASRRQHGPASAGGGGPPQPRQPSPGRRPAPLDANPFSGLPDPGFLYTNGELRALYNKLLASIGARGGLFLLTGEGGTGKTALLTRLAEEMRAAGYRVMTAVPEDRAFRVPAGGPTVLLVDGADDLDDAAIGRLASLLRASGGAGSEPLRLVLSGRPSLAARLVSRKFTALKPALVLYCRLHRLSDPDIAQLIWHRLRRAGHRGPGLFPEEAIAEIARLAHGLPGRALLLGTRAIALAEAAGSLIVFAEFVRQAADALAPRDGDPAAAAVPARAARSPARRIGTALGGLVASSAAAAALFVYAVPDESRASIGYTIVSTIKERLPAAVDSYLADRQQQASGPGGEARAPGPSSAASAIAAGMVTFAQWTTPSGSGQAKPVSPPPPLPADATGSSVDDDYDDDGDAPGAGGSAPVPVRPEPPPSDSVAQPIAADIPAPAVPAAIADEPGRPPDHADDAAPAAADATAATPPAADAAVSEGPSTAPPSQHDETRRDEPQGDEPQAGAAQAGAAQAGEPQGGEQRDGSVAAPGSTAPADGSAAPPHDADAAAAGKTAPAPMPSAAGTPQPPSPSDAVPGSGDGAAVSGTTATAPAVTQPVLPAPASPPPSRPAVAREPSPAAGGGAGAAKAEAVSKETIELLIRRGDTMLATGDISAARLLYERAAAAGDARAATAAGKTYDPIFLQQIGALGVTPRPERAIRWYRQAIDAGDAEAEARMVRLQALGSR
ncbi:MAG TPA: hypothetical protein VGD08_15435 [Stellaceae bacterium]